MIELIKEDLMMIVTYGFTFLAGIGAGAAITEMIERRKDVEQEGRMDKGS